MDDKSDIIKRLLDDESKGKLTNNTNGFDKKNEKKKILIVDDDDSIRRTIRYCFDEINLDYDFDDAKNGEEALKKLKKEKLPDLILLDIMMPEMNGWDLAAEIRKNNEWCQIPILFLTAVSDPDSKNYGKILSDDFITKPFEMDDLIKSVENILKNKNNKV